MNTLAALLPSLALLLPALPAELPGAAPADDAARTFSARQSAPAMGFDPGAQTAFATMREAWRPPQQRQVSIQQRVIIRIAPRSPRAVEQSLATLARQTERYKEKRLEGCVPINMIAGAYPTDDRLLLFMRDRRVLTAALERACSPRDFYSGFYVERSDGQLCERRDRLQSRAGASCRVARLSRLVSSRD